jgi:hypothetical protein
MTKGPGQKHFQREDHEQAAHQAEAMPHPNRLATQKSAGAKTKDETQRDDHPVEQAPKGPRKGQ